VQTSKILFRARTHKAAAKLLLFFHFSSFLVQLLFTSEPISHFCSVTPLVLLPRSFDYTPTLLWFY